MLAGCRIDRFEGLHDRVAVLAAGVAETVADQVNDALLHDRLLPRRVDRFRKPFETVADGDQDVLDATVLQLGEYLQPEPRPFAAITGPDPQNLPLPGRGDAHHDIERGVADLPVSDLDHDRVDEDHRVERVQRSGGPLRELGGDLLRDPTDRVFGHLRAIDLVEMRRDLARRQPPRREGQHDLVDALEPALPLRDNDRLERTITIPGDLDLHWAYLGEHCLDPRPVPHIRGHRRLTVTVAQVLRQLRVQR